MVKYIPTVLGRNLAHPRETVSGPVSGQIKHWEKLNENHQDMASDLYLKNWWFKICGKAHPATATFQKSTLFLVS